MTRGAWLVLFLAALTQWQSPISAQGVQTGTLRGVVLGADGAPEPGASLTLSSPALQGTRTASPEESGTYAFHGLPPGEYEVEIRVPGAEIVRREATVPLDGTAVVDVRLQLAGLALAVDVVAPQLVEPSVRSNYTREQIEPLASPRTLAGLARLAPGVVDAGPTPGPTEGQMQVVINGGFAYDNVFLVNGVDVNDNIFAWPQNLFIEEAIAETQVLTSGISAEYGRFGGGVVNAITRSGGNLFAGSYRLNLANDAWSTESPYERLHDRTRESRTNGIHEGTAGGPFVRERLWFFAAGRYASVESSPTLPVTGIQYRTTDRNRRGELKITGSPWTGHTVQGSALANPREQVRQANFQGRLATIDPFALSDKERPNHLLAFRYSGVVNPRLFIESQYSHQQFATNAGGGTSTDIVDSPFFTFDFTGQYNAPVFDANDPDERNNRQLTASATYFSGGHDLKAGYELFRSQKIGANSQSATGYVFLSDYLTLPDPLTGDPSDVPLLDGEGRLRPIFIPGETLMLQYRATRGASLEIDHHSAYVQDRWRVGRRVTANLGLRVEHVTSRATDTPVGIESTRALPRLGVSFDTSGDGRLLLHATYGHYGARYNDALFLRNSPVGNPIELAGIYDGPPGAGRSFSQGFDPGEYDFEGISAFFPTANVRFDPGLASPLVREFTTSAAADLYRRGSVQATYVWRHTRDIVEDFTSVANGVTHIVEPGVDLVSTNTLYANTDLAFRDYQALLFEGRYRAGPGVTVQGNWTVQLENDGNYEGERPHQVVTSQIGDYPEIFIEARHYPSGRLPSFQRHRVHLWSVYDRDFGRFGDLSLSGLWRYNSGRTYTLRAEMLLTATQAQALEAAGYPDMPALQTVHYSPLGAGRFRGYGVVDTAATYNVPLAGRVRPWVKAEVFNLFNNQKLISWNTSVVPDTDTSTDSLGIPVGYAAGPSFGQAADARDYPVPFPGATGGRTLRIAVGVRF